MSTHCEEQMSGSDLSIRSLPYLDVKWLRADLHGALQSTEDLAVLWNNLIRDNELVLCSANAGGGGGSGGGGQSTTAANAPSFCSPPTTVINSAGNISYIGPNGRHYCGVQKLLCSCCTGYCRPLSDCNCAACHQLDNEEPPPSSTKKSSATSTTSTNSTIPSDSILDSWLWGPIPTSEEKSACIKSLLSEQRELSLQAAGHSLSAIHLRQRLYIYHRYFTALARYKPPKPEQIRKTPDSTPPDLKLQKCGSIESDSQKDAEKATLGLARVGTRAALNFSFAFLRRAWRSGEDTDLCSELLQEALEAMQGLPEASLFDSSAVSQLWVEVLERSVKFLRQVVLGDVMGGRCLVPKADRHIALSLLLELGSQKGTLSASLEAVLLLLTLWDKEKDCDDNRLPPQAIGAPIVSILKRYEQISYSPSGGSGGGGSGDSEVPSGTITPTISMVNNSAVPPSSSSSPPSVTEQFLRSLVLPDQETINIDLKQAAVIIISHLDRLATPHIPIGSFTSKTSQKNQSQQIFTLGSLSVSLENYGFTAEPVTEPPSVIGFPRGGGGNGIGYRQVPSNTKIGNILPSYTATQLDFGPNLLIRQVVCSEKIVHILSTKGEVFILDTECSNNNNNSCGSSAGINSVGNGEQLQQPTQVEGFGGVAIQRLAAHCEGKHFMALTVDNQVYSWGFGEGGRLGHGDVQPRTTPTKIQYFNGIPVTKIYCGAAYSAAISLAGTLYTWGRGFYGSLGTGSSDDKLVPTIVQALSDYCVVDVALGSGDSHSLCVTYEGYVFAWGDNDFGKLGISVRGCHLPIRIKSLSGIVRCYSGSQFSVALSADGEVYTWGKSHGGRLGHHNHQNGLSTSGGGGSVGISSSTSTTKPDLEDCYTPKRVTELEGKIIVDIAVGSAHCLALTNNGEVFGWGRNDFHQICPPSICRDPIIHLPIQATPPSLRISGMACGPAQSILWRHSSTIGVATRIPFVVDLSESTFRFIDQLLAIVCGGGFTNVISIGNVGGGGGGGNTSTTSTAAAVAAQHQQQQQQQQQQHQHQQQHAPSQEFECIAVACLNLLRLQLHSLLTNHIDPQTIGLGEGSRLLTTLKTRILMLAGGPTTMKSMQDAAQWALQIGWSVFLPTASERAKTLTSLLPSEPGVSTSGHRFMTDLLVSSLMAEEGLQTALKQAINAAEPEDCQSSSSPTANSGHNLPLLHLIKQLLRNNSAVTQARLGQLVADSYHKTYDDYQMPDTLSPSLDLLHRFQRLLLSHIHQSKIDDMIGAEALLAKYIHHVVTLCVATLSKAHEVALQGRDGIVEILNADISDTLLYELLIGLVLLHRDQSPVLPSFDWTKHFVPLLNVLDNLNRLIADSDIQDSDDMGWPAIICRGAQKTCNIPEESQLIRQSDLDNHILDGGNWIVLNGYVYDVQDYQCENQTIMDILQNGLGKDLSAELNAPQFRCFVDHISMHFKVGKFVFNDAEEKMSNSQCVNLTHLHSERTLAYLLGLRAGLLQKGPILQPAEIQCKHLLKSPIFSGGLQVLQPTNPFDEEKGEARSSASTAGSTPTETSIHMPISELPQQALWPHMLISHRVDLLLSGLGEARLTDPVVATWIIIMERYCKQNNLIWHQDFPPEHPISELERHLTAVFIRHQSIGPLVLAVIDRELSGSIEKLPGPVSETIKLVHQTKWTLIKTRQQLNRSYKEVCAPMLDKCRFLLYEVRPVISMEQAGLSRLNILHREPRFKSLVRLIISEIQMAKKMHKCAKPDDILNVTIQSQQQQHQQQQHGHLHLTLNKNQSNENLRKVVSTDNLLVNKCFSVENMSNGGSEAVTPKNQSNENLLLDGVGGGGGGGVVGGGGCPGGDDSNVITEKMEIDELKTPMNNDNYHKQKSIESDELFINNVIAKLSEKCIRVCEYGQPSSTVMGMIVDFILQDNCDVETLRRAMYCQVQRYQIRKQGITMFTELIRVSGLLDAVQYNILSGFLGLFLDKPKQQFSGNILDDLNMITAFQKANLILAHSKIIEWAIEELQKFINQEQAYGKQKYHGGKDNTNLGTYVFLKKLPRARFLLSVFGILSKDCGPNEISLIINSGALGSILGLLRQTGGGDMGAAAAAASKISNELSFVYEDTILRQKTTKTNVTGSELAKLMKIGTRIVRGADWKWGDQDGLPPGEGRIISEVGEDGWVRVEWDTGATNSYRMGKEGQYDLRLADNTSTIVSPDTETEDDLSQCEMHLSGISHPTKLLKNACTKMLKIISVSVGQHANKMDKTAVKNISSMFRAVLTSKMGFLNLGLEHWTTLGFLRAISTSKNFSHYLTTPVWINLHIDILNSATTCEQDVYKKVQSLRVLQATLVNWTDDDMLQINDFIEKIFLVLGKTVMICPNDLSLLQNPADVKARVLLASSHSGTVAEEIISLLRKLHTLPVWNSVINSFLAQKLCIATELLGKRDRDETNETDKSAVMSALYIIGGCDPRPRIGLNLTHEGLRGTIRNFTHKGKTIVSVHNSPDVKKLSITIAKECADIGAFSLSKLPLNEMLLNSWSILLYGPPSWRTIVKIHVEVALLRYQQIHLAALNATSVLFRHQSSLRKILRQRTRGLSRVCSKESISEQIETNEELENKESIVEEKEQSEENNENKDNKEVEMENFEDGNDGREKDFNIIKDEQHILEENNDNILAIESNNASSEETITEPQELLIQTMLARAVQYNPVKALYSYAELAMAALNITQHLASHAYSEVNYSSIALFSRYIPPQLQPTMVHGVPIYNDGMMMLEEILTPSSEGSHFGKRKQPPTQIVAQIMEMGFSRSSVELAIKSLPTPVDTVKIVHWILEHPDLCPPVLPSAAAVSLHNGGGIGRVGGGSSVDANVDYYADSDSDSASTDTVEGYSSGINDVVPVGGDGVAATTTVAAGHSSTRYSILSDFKSPDQYAIYVRGIVQPGMTVKCCEDFEEIHKGDIGTVLKVDPEGLHDLNVQVDWQAHGATYWMCFTHIEIINNSTTKSGVDELNSKKPEAISVGSQVKLRLGSKQQTPLDTAGNSCGIVTAIVGDNVTVDFPQQSGWIGQLNEIECTTEAEVAVTQPILSNTENGEEAVGDLIEDWSRCIRSLTVSSNESSAKFLLKSMPHYWVSNSNSGKHWIRLEMHDNVLIHMLALTVCPNDCSHMPSLVVVRVGETEDTLKDYNWLLIKPTDVHVPLLSDITQYYPWIEIVIKQCRNNGIQCKVHAVNVIGRRKQSAVEMLLMDASFLSTELDPLCEQPSTSQSHNYPEDRQDQLQSKVLVWGLNDKEQLGGMKGSKVKTPTYSPAYSALRPVEIVGGSKSLFLVSQEGKVYACGEGTNGRLGLGHNFNVALPHKIPILSQYVVKKVAVHSGGKHAMALTLDGKVFSWGEGEDGKLGHGNRLTMDRPKLIEALKMKKIRDIACGSSHSAAITGSGELYTWGLGEYGRLGHGDIFSQLKPRLVTALLGHRIVQVACGSRDAQTLALTEDNLVFSWGDGDFGKLGRGGSEGCLMPRQIERLNGVGIVQIACGAQFSLALSKSGEVWTWGKGDYYRLGHGNDNHVRKPTPVLGLRGKKVVHVAVGALHCLAVLDTGEVYSWGDNDHGQQGCGTTTVNKKPSLVHELENVFVNRVACGSSHSIAYTLPQCPVEDEKKDAAVVFSSAKDPLGSNGLGIYDSETSSAAVSIYSGGSGVGIGGKLHKPSLSEVILSLETYGARQTALNHVLNAMSVIQARQCIVAALTSHSQLGSFDKISDSEHYFKELEEMHSPTHTANPNQDVIAHGGGEGPADPPQLTAVLGGSSGGVGGSGGGANGSIAQEPLTPDSDHMPSIPPVAGPLSAFQSLTGSMSLSASISSVNVTQRHSKMSASAMSVMAATMTHQDEVINYTELTGLDEFTALLGEAEAKHLVELLKLSVAGRTGPPSSVQTIASTLIALGVSSPPIGKMILETCITELEDLCTSRHFLGKMPKPVVQETSHPYIDDITLVGHVKIPGAEALRLEFDSQCSTEKRNDPLIIMDGSGRVIATRSGREYTQWAPEIKIPGDEMRWKFTSDSSVNGWGWKFWVHAVMPPFFLQELGSDRAVLSQPSMDMVMALLDSRLEPQCTPILLRLASAIAACTQLSTLTTPQRIWALKKLHAILKSKHAPQPLDSSLTTFLLPLIPGLLKQYEYEESQVRGGVHLMHSEYFKTLAALACDMQLDSLLPTGEMHKWAWFRRYCTAVRVAQSLINRSPLPRSFITEVRKKLNEMMPNQSISGLSSIPAATAGPSSLSVNSGSGGGSTSVFNELSTSSNSLSRSPAGSINASLGGASSNSTPYTVPPGSFVQFIDSISSASTSTIEEMTTAGHRDAQNQFIHEDHQIFKAQHDRQLLQWLNRRPEDWALSWGGASTIYGWGHNHRGQLGGLEGGRIKSPTPCESLSLLRPIQLCGGEQTLYAVTPDGKLFATGYGAGGRLGIGGTDSVSTPILVESLQHVFIKKVAVNSGGKHCLALTADGEVYSWGEGEDGKLAHGNRINYDRPKLIEALSGIGVVDIACGSAHSACITSSGHVLTWGKGRYGRLGHGDSEDHLRPKMVEALLGYRAVDIACGSGDAQTVCITDDDNVWSWGDGDYGKLGRGGSDGCKFPQKIESLAGLGVIKVECGSQFSVALTRSGAVYTWGKGDYHRLGHGTADHVRRPRKVAALQGKKIVSIATGSLHCVACSDAGEVFTWGDNDEGQLGDGTVSAIQRPRLVQALQGKHIVKVTCGSAHTLALSTTQLTEGSRPPPIPPLEYDFVRDLPPESLHSRLVLLHHFSELLCPCLAMLPITGGDLSLGALKDVLVYSIKEAAFRKVIQTTMVRDKQHGPVIELNRIQVKRSRSRSGGGLAGVDGLKSVFGQMVQKLPLLNQEALYLPHRVWKVKFVGESVDDCGGGFSESIAEMCDELQNGSVPLLIQTPNGRGEAGANRDCFLLDPTLTSVLQMNMFRFLGVLMGIAVRTGSPLSLNLAEPVWRQLAGESLRPSDLTEVDRDYVASLICIRDMDDDPKVFQTLELPFSTPSAKGHEIPLSTRYTRITPQNKHEYVRLALNHRLHEFDEQVKAVRDGMSKVIPVPLLSLFSASQLQAMVCGSPEIPLALLKSVATYKGIDATSSLVQWFWEVMEEFSNQERSLFLRFVWGRTRLPRTIADFRGRDFVLQVLDKYNPADHFLPESYTCFFLLKMPRYSCKPVLLEKLKYAIYFCKSIDTDEYARVAMVEPTELTVSENNSDLDSEVSEDL